MVIELNCAEPIRIIPGSQEEGVQPANDGKTELHCNDPSFKKMEIFPKGIENPSQLFRCLSTSLEQFSMPGSFIWKLESTEPQHFDLSFLAHCTQLKIFDISRNNLKSIGNLTVLSN